MFSVLTNIDLANYDCSNERRSFLNTNDESHAPISRSGLPRLAPQCGGIVVGSCASQIANSSQHSSLQSLVSLCRTNTCPSNQLQKPSPRSLQVSPALAQRSLYAQHILSSPEVIGVNTTDSRHHQHAKSALKTATSEFSFIRPDSPLTLPHNRSSHVQLHPSHNKKPVYSRSQSNLEAQQRQKINNNHATLQYDGYNMKTKSNNAKVYQTTRPSSIYGQPSLTEKSFIINNRRANNYYYHHDVASSNGTLLGEHVEKSNCAGNGLRDTKSMPKRHIRQYKQSKSETLFGTSNRSQSIANKDSPSITIPNSVLMQGNCVRNNKSHQNQVFAVR